MDGRYNTENMLISAVNIFAVHVLAVHFFLRTLYRVKKCRGIAPKTPKNCFSRSTLCERASQEQCASDTYMAVWNTPGTAASSMCAWQGLGHGERSPSQFLFNASVQQLYSSGCTDFGCTAVTGVS